MKNSNVCFLEELRRWHIFNSYQNGLPREYLLLDRQNQRKQETQGIVTVASSKRDVLEIIE